MVDEIYATILKAKEVCSEQDMEKLDAPLQKYYETKGMMQENMEMLIKFCEKSLKWEIFFR